VSGHDELSDLYQEVLLDHNRRPRNRRALASPSTAADGFNPLCGDRVHLELVLAADGRIQEAAFSGEGCAISTASSSLLTEAVTGKTEQEARELAAAVREMLTSPAGGGEARLGKLAALAGVREYPMRVKCATLAWHTLLAALDQPSAGAAAPVRTE
jgi:nitrogen fixation NifU-like protein